MPIRSARPDDTDAIVAMITELATYERAADQVRVTAAGLREAMFSEPARVFGLIAETEDAVPAGFALYFLSFSTWEGVHGIYLEDLFVRPEHRGHGFGRGLLARLARLAVERGYARVDWQVLDWNQSAIETYRALGGVPMQGWLPYRLTGDALRTLAG